MKRFTLACLAVVALIVTAAPSTAEDSTTLTGEYRWSRRDNNGDLEAVFKPTGDEQWDVSFYFTWRGDDHVYSGTAEGSLTDGELSGTVLNDNKKRTFTFAGSVEGGVFEGIHKEITGGKEERTGTLTLRH